MATLLRKILIGPGLQIRVLVYFYYGKQKWRHGGRLGALIITERSISDSEGNHRREWHWAWLENLNPQCLPPLINFFQLDNNFEKWHFIWAYGELFFKAEQILTRIVFSCLYVNLTTNRSEDLLYLLINSKREVAIMKIITFVQL